ncbi:hypothetical protein ACFPMF_17620 [Larkinella bovis]|uniref:Uncharacterized protein n=1 Tax=Larkinella bovis TaxID=683041 RepID=A0ABW0ICA8_9BACT
MLERLFNLYLEHPLELIHDIATIAPVILGIFYADTKKYEVRFLILFFLIIFFRNLISNIYAANKINNIFLYNFIGFIEVITFGLIYYFSVNRPNYKKIIVLTASIVFLTNIVFWEKNEFSAGIFTITRIYSLFLALLYFMEILAEMRVKNILKHSLFWISSGIIIQATGTILIFLFSKVILSTKTTPEIFFVYWNFILVTYIAFCLFVSVGFWVSKYDKDNYTVEE